MSVITSLRNRSLLGIWQSQSATHCNQSRTVDVATNCAASAMAGCSFQPEASTAKVTLRLLVAVTPAACGEPCINPATDQSGAGSPIHASLDPASVGLAGCSGRDWPSVCSSASAQSVRSAAARMIASIVGLRRFGLPPSLQTLVVMSKQLLAVTWHLLHPHHPSRMHAQAHHW